MQQKRESDMVLSGNMFFWVLWNPVEFKLPFFFLLKALSLLKVQTKAQKGQTFFFFFIFSVATDRSPGIQQCSQRLSRPILPRHWRELEATKLHNPKKLQLSPALLKSENVCWKIPGAEPPSRGGFGAGTHQAPNSLRWKSVLNSKCSISALSPHEL